MVDTSKYIFIEKLVYCIISVITSCTAFPAFNLAFEKKDNLVFWSGTFAIFASCMYHSMDAFKTNGYTYPIILIDWRWHIIDNIGMIICMSILLCKYYNFKSANSDKY